MAAGSSKQRLDKVLAGAGFGTRKDVKELCRRGEVKVDGNIVKDSSTHVDPTSQVVEVVGQALNYREHIYLMMNKPEGVISATEDSREETVLDLLEPEHKHYEPFPVGRLDKDTVGLLLLTDDGALSHGLLSPRRHVPKCYQVLVKGKVGKKEIDAVEKGIVLDDGYKTLPGNLRIPEGEEAAGLDATPAAGESLVLITINEGKYHQVKRMFQALGMPVLQLKRLSMGPLSLDESLEPGEYRELTEKELSDLREAAGPHGG